MVLDNPSHIYFKIHLHYCPYKTQTHNKRTTEVINFATTNLELWKFNLKGNIAPPLLTRLMDSVTRPAVGGWCSCIVMLMQYWVFKSGNRSVITQFAFFENSLFRAFKSSLYLSLTVKCTQNLHSRVIYYFPDMFRTITTPNRSL
jgi:hypothetical protein